MCKQAIATERGIGSPSTSCESIGGKRKSNCRRRSTSSEASRDIAGADMAAKLRRPKRFSRRRVFVVCMSTDGTSGGGKAGVEKALLSGSA